MENSLLSAFISPFWLTRLLSSGIFDDLPDYVNGKVYLAAEPRVFPIVFFSDS